jgi:G3E family GTPase
MRVLKLQALVPITLLPSFLGAGKAILLNRIIHGDHERKIAVIVSIDGASV